MSTPIKRHIADFFQATTDTFSAEVIEADEVSGQYIVQPLMIEADGKDTPEMPALAADAIKPAVGDIVLIVTSRNNYDHELQNRVTTSAGANMIIVAVFSDELTRDAIINITEDLNVGGNFNLTGNATLGAGTKKMVLGESLAEWAQSVDAALQLIIAWGANGVAPGPTGGIAPLAGVTQPVWSNANLSTHHKLD